MPVLLDKFQGEIDDLATRQFGVIGRYKAEYGQKVH